MNELNIVFGGASLAGEGAGYALSSLKGCSPSELVNRAIDYGISFFDFAPIYGFNNAEKVMGMAIKNQRDKVKLISKGGVDWHSNNRVNMTNDPKVIAKMFENSLKNFNSDYIDVYFIHWPDSKVDIRYSVEVLFDLYQKGKIHSIGLSNSNLNEFLLAKEVAPIDYLQAECNLFTQSPFTIEGINSMGWGTFDKGILSSAVTAKRKFEKSDARSHAFWWKKSNWKEKVEFVSQVKEKFGLSDNELKSIALKFSSETVNMPIIGFSSIEQLDEIMNLKCSISCYEEVKNEFTLF